MDEAEVLERLLRIPSPSGSEGAAVREFVRIARRLGYRCRVDQVGNGIASRGTGRPRVMFLGHIDTVPGARRVRRSRGRLSGRGAVDAKAALAAALIAGTKAGGKGRLEIVAAVGEETDSRGARALLRSGPADAVIAGEPNRWDGVAIGYRGCLRIEATFTQGHAHATAPLGPSADRAVRWAALAQSALEQTVEGSPFRSTSVRALSLTSDGGRIDSTLLTLELRLPPGTTAGGFLVRLPHDPKPQKVVATTSIDPFETDRPDPVVEALVSGIRSAGGRPTLWRKGGTSDLNLVARAWGCPGAAYGPGDSKLDHTDRESVSERELARSVQVLSHAFRRLAEIPLPSSTPPRDLDPRPTSE